MIYFECFRNYMHQRLMDTRFVTKQFPFILCNWCYLSNCTRWPRADVELQYYGVGNELFRGLVIWKQSCDSSLWCKHIPKNAVHMGPKSIMFFSVLSENLDCVATYDALLGMCAENPPGVRGGNECDISDILNKTHQACNMLNSCLIRRLLKRGCLCHQKSDFRGQMCM